MEMHNVALKWARRDCELRGLPYKQFDLSSARQLKIPPMIKPLPNNPEAYEFIGEAPDEQWEYWHPIWLLSNIRDKDSALVIKGPQLRQDVCVVAIDLRNTDPYDHARESTAYRTQWREHAATLRGERKMARWDFVVTRSDGTKCWLHPSWGSPDIRYGEVDESLPPNAPPKAGHGQWDWQGHYKVFEDQRTGIKFKCLASRCLGMLQR